MRNFVVNEVPSKADSTWLLYHGIKNLLRCDEAEVVSAIAAYVMAQHGVLAKGSALMERARQTPLPPIAALLGFTTRFLEVHEANTLDGIAWVARLGNERRAIERAISTSPRLDWTEFKFGRPPDLRSLGDFARLTGLGPRRILSIARRLHRKHPFFKVLRSVELIGYYARYLSLFRKGRYSLAVISSHSNPHSIAFNLAARRTGVPVVLITHGMPVRPVARLEYDLAVVHCEAARQTYLEEGCKFGRMLVHGRRHHHRQMSTGELPQRVAVGIFLCKDVNQERLREVVENLLANPRVSAVLIRPHPKNLWRGLVDWLESRNDSRLTRASGVDLTQDLDAVDIVFAGNSSVLVDAVTAGRPSVYVTSLDYGSHDMHQFVRRGLIYSDKDDMNEPGQFHFDPDEVLRFYQQPQWPSVLRLFANIDEDEEAVLTRLASEMSTLLEGR
jgi:hypothetical protein